MKAMEFYFPGGATELKFSDLAPRPDISEALTGIARLFADDTSLSFSSADPLEIERILNHDLSKLSTWAKILLVIFNATKTEVLITSSIYFDYDIRLVMDDTILKIVRHP